MIIAYRQDSMRLRICYRLRNNKRLLKLLLLSIIFCYFYATYKNYNRDDKRFVEMILEEALKIDKGEGCDIPRFDPYAPEVMKFDKKLPKTVCGGQDWVKCYLSKCKVVPAILDKFNNIVCFYTDIIHITDFKRRLGKTTGVYDSDVLILTESDHVFINCTGNRRKKLISSSWSGYGTGLRPVKLKPAPPGREHTYNVLIFGFDSTAKNGFIRKMPKSFKFLTEEVNATVLNKYNIVGDGTPAALFPILTGKREHELPDVKKHSSKKTLDSFPFIFKILKQDGYRTAYFEDMPRIGTFQYRMNGWKKQPTDHYLRALFMEKQYRPVNSTFHCFGDTPSFKVMINLTEQFMTLPGKRFIFNFIGDISHNNFNKIQIADEDTVLFLRNFMNSGLKENTLLIVMGDHGPRYADVRTTLQGKLEERLPLMAIRLPDRLVANRPEALTSLMHNAEVLTTPHDLHATILDAIDMTQRWDPYKIPGADLPRAVSLLQTIPKSRSCSEASVEPHWCACLSWKNVSISDPLYQNAANKLIDFVNNQTEPMRTKCAIRNLILIHWVKEHRMKQNMEDKKSKGRQQALNKNIDVIHLQVKLTVGPGNGMYEASLTHHKSTNELVVNPREISRINAYGHEPDCVSATHPHLNPYCYCTYTSNSF